MEEKLLEILKNEIQTLTEKNKDLKELIINVQEENDNIKDDSISGLLRDKKQLEEAISAEKTEYIKAEYVADLEKVNESIDTWISSKLQEILSNDNTIDSKEKEELIVEEWKKEKKQNDEYNKKANNTKKELENRKKDAQKELDRLTNNGKKTFLGDMPVEVSEVLKDIEQIDDEYNKTKDLQEKENAKFEKIEVRYNELCEKYNVREIIKKEEAQRKAKEEAQRQAEEEEQRQTEEEAQQEEQKAEGEELSAEKTTAKKQEEEEQNSEAGNKWTSEKPIEEIRREGIKEAKEALPKVLKYIITDVLRNPDNEDNLMKPSELKDKLGLSNIYVAAYIIALLNRENIVQNDRVCVTEKEIIAKLEELTGTRLDEEQLENSTAEQPTEETQEEQPEEQPDEEEQEEEEEEEEPEPEHPAFSEEQEEQESEEEAKYRSSLKTQIEVNKNKKYRIDVGKTVTIFINDKKIKLRPGDFKRAAELNTIRTKIDNGKQIDTEEISREVSFYFEGKVSNRVYQLIETCLYNETAIDFTVISAIVFADEKELDKNTKESMLKEYLTSYLNTDKKAKSTDKTIDSEMYIEQGVDKYLEENSGIENQLIINYRMDELSGTRWRSLLPFFHELNKWEKEELARLGNVAQRKGIGMTTGQYEHPEEIPEKTTIFTKIKSFFKKRFLLPEPEKMHTPDYTDEKTLKDTIINDSDLEAAYSYNELRNETQEEQEKKTGVRGYVKLTPENQEKLNRKAYALAKKYEKKGQVKLSDSLSELSHYHEDEYSNDQEDEIDY